jgi:serine/threonine-protein kinase HipA
MTDDSASAVLLQRPDGSWVEAGYLHHSGNRNWFEFAESYWELSDRPVIGQIFEEHGRQWRPSAHVALPRWFGHLLPEGQVRELVARSAHSSEANEYELLARLGVDDLPGAVRVFPADGRRSAFTPGESSGDEPDADDPLLKFSLAGVQLKFSVARDDRGLTVPAVGRAGDVILKFPDGRPGFGGVPEAELGALTLASQAGIDAVRAELVDPRSVRGLENYADNVHGMALAVRRFDRADDDRRVHMEELAQILDISTAKRDAKYLKANFETVAVVLAALTGVDSVGSIIDRIVLNVLVGNGDAHLKNWAVTYPDGRIHSSAPHTTSCRLCSTSPTTISVSISPGPRASRM